MSFTIIDSMFEHAAFKPDATAFRFIADLDHKPQELSCKELLQEAAAIALFLREVAAPGSRIMLFFPPGLAYIKAFYGCLLAGMVAVPLYPPRRNVKSDRVIKVAQSCQSQIALTTQLELATVQASWDEQNTIGLPLSFYASDTIAAFPNQHFDRPAIESSAPAFLQYTSGSTGIPKGVIVTHDNIIANLMHVSLMSTGNKDDIFVNWLPLFHDLGLITAVLWPVFLGAPSILMAPATFVRNPVTWLQAITRYRGTMCGAPNFAYDLCIDKIEDAELAGIDLSSWRVAYNAAEPVRAETLDRFTARFSACGFKSESFYPAYGMAEATVFISGGDSSAKPIQLTVNKKTVAEEGIDFVEQTDPLATRIVACGAALPPHDLRIVDPQTGRALEDGKVGEIWFAGPSVSPGYWQLAEQTAATFNQRIEGEEGNGYRYLRTGDLGVTWQGEVYVTGRIKDLIILRGRNYYPQDIELSTAKAHEAIRPGYCAAFSVEEVGLERLVVVTELEREYFRSIDPDEVISAVRQRVFIDHEVNVDQVVLLKPYKIPVTSSGKIQRRQTRQMLLDGELETIAQSDTSSIREYVEPVSELEKTLCHIWQGVLKRECIGTTDNFLDIGGNSLTAIDITSRVRKHFEASVDLSIDELMAFPTIARLAEYIELKIAHAGSKVHAASDHPRKTVRI